MRTSLQFLGIEDPSMMPISIYTFSLLACLGRACPEFQTHGIRNKLSMRLSRLMNHGHNIN